MVWTIILILLGLLLAFLLFTPAHLRVGYDQGDVTARVRFGPLKLQLYPRPEKPAGEEEKPKKEKAKKEKPAKEPKPKANVNLDQILYSVEVLPPILGRALRRVGKRLRFAPLKLHLLVAGEDPAKTAQLFGKLEAALSAGVPRLEQLVHVKGQDIRLFLDFQEERMDCIADVGVSIRLWDLLVIALCAGGSALKWFIGFRKLADKPAENTAPTPGKENKMTPSGADAA